MTTSMLHAARTATFARRLAAVLALGAGMFLRAAPALAVSSPWVDARVDAADVTAAYGGSADEITLTEARAQLLELVNQTRQEAGLTALEPLELAAAVAQDQSQEMVARRLVGHYDAAGHACEQRFNAAGGVDQISENTAYYEIDYHVYLTPQLVSRIQSHWLGSPSHRAAILDPAHTHLGAGFSVRRTSGPTRVAAVAEFVKVYGDYVKLPARAHLGEVIQLSGRLDPARAVLGYLGVGVTEPPQPVAPGQAQKPGYSTPQVVLALVSEDRSAGIAPGIRFVRYGVDYNEFTGEFTAQVQLDSGWPAAAYYFTAWAAAPETADQFFCTMVQVVLVE